MIRISFDRASHQELKIAPTTHCPPAFESLKRPSEKAGWPRISNLEDTIFEKIVLCQPHRRFLGSLSTKDILSPLLWEFVSFFQGAPPFFLTGETALSAFYLQHRYSEDLDPFTLDSDAFDRVPFYNGRYHDKANCLGCLVPDRASIPSL